MKLKYTYSIRGRSLEAACRQNGDVLFNLNIIANEHHRIATTNEWHKMFRSEEYISSFVAYLAAIELHELGHVYNFIGCNHKKQPCAWCKETNTLYRWLL